jgi:hypothetical protein
MTAQSPWTTNIHDVLACAEEFTARRTQNPSLPDGYVTTLIEHNSTPGLLIFRPAIPCLVEAFPDNDTGNWHTRTWVGREDLEPDMALLALHATRHDGTAPSHIETINPPAAPYWSDNRVMTADQVARLRVFRALLSAGDHARMRFIYPLLHTNAPGLQVRSLYFSEEINLAGTWHGYPMNFTIFTNSTTLLEIWDNNSETQNREPVSPQWICRVRDGFDARYGASEETILAALATSVTTMAVHTSEGSAQFLVHQPAK